jgi:hyperosmotically inducible protein
MDGFLADESRLAARLQPQGLSNRPIQQRKRINMKKTIGFGGLLAAGAMLAIPAGMYASAGSNTGGNLEDHVRHELVMLPYYNVFDTLSFRVDDGTVILFGQVTNPVVKDDAERSVKHLEGVKSVRNEIEVLPLSSFDDRIRVSTYRAIYGYGPLQRYGLGSQPPIHIIVKNGNTTLAGVVANDADRTLAYVRANSVPGVFSVTNGLQVER